MDFVKPLRTASPTQAGTQTGTGGPSILGVGLVGWELLQQANEVIYNAPSVYDPVEVNDPMLQGQPIGQAELVKVGQKNKLCVIAVVRTKGSRQLKSKVMIARDATKIALLAYQYGWRDGDLNRKRGGRNNERCQSLRLSINSINRMLKNALLSQVPSFPRKKSKTGVTRIGRRRKGPG